MQVNFNTTSNNSYQQSFKSIEITKYAKKLITSKLTSTEETDIFERFVHHLDEKESTHTIMYVKKEKLTAIILYRGRHNETLTEDPLSCFGNTTINFLEKVANRADAVEEMCRAEVKLENLAEFNNEIITKSALTHLKARQLPLKDVNQLEKLLKQLDDPKKERLVTVSFSENHGDLTALLFSSGKYSENITEGWFSHLFCSPIGFMEKCVQRASQVEQKLKTATELNDIAKGN